MSARRRGAAPGPRSTCHPAGSGRPAKQPPQENEKPRPVFVVQLRPTSPLRPRGLVDRAVETLIEHKEADSARGVVPAAQNQHKMWALSNGGALQPLGKVKGPH